MAPQMKTVHRLKVTPRQVRPPVWRRIEVSSNMKLSDLADVLEAAMGWLGCHLHSFEADGMLYETPAGESLGFRRPRDERKARLGEVLPGVKSKMRWDYDFGDGWQHDVVVEAIEPARAGVTYPVCLTGKRACPSEDCGGPWGYSNLLTALSDPSHEEHEELTEWVGEDFDPAHFDAGEATEDMRSARPLKGW